MGHREYRLVDPRASVLKRMAEKVAAEPSLNRLYRTLLAVEAAFVAQTSAKSRLLRANMEFYKGIVCLGLGILEGAVHRDVRRQPRLRLDRAYQRTACRQPADPAIGALRGAPPSGTRGGVAQDRVSAQPPNFGLPDGGCQSFSAQTSSLKRRSGWRL